MIDKTTDKRKVSMKTFWEISETFPPVLVRLLARQPHGRPMSVVEIAVASGLTEAKVEVLSRQTTWRDIDLPTMRAYVIGCGVDFCEPTQMKRVKSYLNSIPVWRHLRKSDDWRKVYSPLMTKYLQSVQKNA